MTKISPIQKLMEQLNWHTNRVIFSLNKKEQEISQKEISKLYDKIKLEFKTLCGDLEECDIALEGDAGMRVELVIPWMNIVMKPEDFIKND